MEEILLSTKTAMFLETQIKPDKRSTTKVALAKAISDIINLMEHLLLELNLRKSDINNEIDELANIITVDYEQSKITAEVRIKNLKN